MTTIQWWALAFAVAQLVSLGLILIDQIGRRRLGLGATLAMTALSTGLIVCFLMLLIPPTI